MYFTICIPAYNRGYILERALESVRKQRFDSYEVIIVDDGSTDNTKKVVEEYLSKYKLEDKFRYYYKPNGGKHTALNVGIDKAKGKFFVILDSDDWLADEALENMYRLCLRIENDDAFCGIMGRMSELKSGKIEGALFDLANPVSSYFDFHFLMKKKHGERFNCVEANKTILLKQYRYPEQDGMRFVPEAWMFDQIGVEYKLYLTNAVFRFSEYMEDGMNADKKFKENHNTGFLYHYVSRIENVLPKKELSAATALKLKSIAWLQYWNCVKMDTEQKGPRVKRITPLGYVCRGCLPFIHLLFKSKFGR